MIVLTELIRSCSHEKVAEAAVASIGPGFRRLIADAAEARRLSIGAYTSACVHHFALEAEDNDWQDLSIQVEGSDMPILTGLRHILEASLPADLRQLCAVRDRGLEPRACGWR
jgi:hypothetical protein